MTSWDQRIAQNVSEVRQRIAEAASRSGRDSTAVTLVAVTKYVGTELTRAVLAAGCRDVGESRPQQLWNKSAELSDTGAVWHLVGHLQRNKVRRTVATAAWLQSIDSWELLQAVDAAAVELGRSPAILLEVNISGDVAKHGFLPPELSATPWPITSTRAVRIEGLMGMSGLNADIDTARRQFATLRQIRDQLVDRGTPNWPCQHLSMGMSGDFELAIEEGATMVRVGSALFDGVEEHHSR